MWPPRWRQRDLDLSRSRLIATAACASCNRATIAPPPTGASFFWRGAKHLGRSAIARERSRRTRGAVSCRRRRSSSALDDRNGNGVRGLWSLHVFVQLRQLFVSSSIELPFWIYKWTKTDALPGNLKLIPIKLLPQRWQWQGPVTTSPVCAFNQNLSVPWELRVASPLTTPLLQVYSPVTYIETMFLRKPLRLLLESLAASTL